MSKLLINAETRYPAMEKLALAVVMAARKLTPYFQSYSILVIIFQPYERYCAVQFNMGDWLSGPSNRANTTSGTNPMQALKRMCWPTSPSYQSLRLAISKTDPTNENSTSMELPGSESNSYSYRRTNRTTPSQPDSTSP